MINYSLALAVFTALALDLYTFGDICTELYSNQFSVLNLKKMDYILWLGAHLAVLQFFGFVDYRTFDRNRPCTISGTNSIGTC